MRRARVAVLAGWLCVLAGAVACNADNNVIDLSARDDGGHVIDRRHAAGDASLSRDADTSTSDASHDDTNHGDAASSATDAAISGGDRDAALPALPNGDPNAPKLTVTELSIPTPSDPGAICAGPDGKLWFTHQSTAPNAVTSVDPAGNMFNLFKTSTTNTGPVAIAAGPDGNVWFTKQNGIGHVTPDGKVTELGVPNGGDSGGITQGPDGNLWFTQPIKSKVSRVTPSGEFKEYVLPTPNSRPLAITVGPDGNLWLTESASTANKIARITPAGVVTEYPIPTPASNPVSIATGPDGNLWFSEHDAHQLGKITPAGAITEYPVANHTSPGAIVSGPDGNLWFTAAGSANALGRMTPSGAVDEYAIPSAASDPTGITVGPDHNLWFSELSTNKLGRVTNLMGGGELAPGAAADGGKLSDGTTCANDTDCKSSGMACGGDVCNVASHSCLLAVSADPGSCSADSNCWCHGEGASCDTSKHHCSFTQHGGGAAPSP